MKKIFIFILGMISGIILFCICSYLLVKKPGGTASLLNPGLTVFDEPQLELPYKEFEVMQVLADGSALAHASNEPDKRYMESCPIVFIFSPQNGGYFDKQRLCAPEGTVARQIGTYSYHDGYGDKKTVPAIGFFEK